MRQKTELKLKIVTLNDRELEISVLKQYPIGRSHTFYDDGDFKIESHNNLEIRVDCLYVLGDRDYKKGDEVSSWYTFRTRAAREEYIEKLMKALKVINKTKLSVFYE